MSTAQTEEEQIAVACNRRHDISYRTGLIMQVIGAALLAVLYPLESPFFTIGIMLFEVGVLISAVSLLIWKRIVKKIIIGSVLIGLALQVAGFFAAPEHAGSIMIAGIGLVCVGAAGMVGKEAYCFGYPEGWLLMIGFPLMVLANLLGKENHIFNSLGFSALFLLLLSLAGKKLNQKLLPSCPPNVRGVPGEM